MADNYLEKRMADHASGRLAASSRKPYVTGATSRDNCPCALVIDGLSPDGEATVRQLATQGWSVSFLGRDMRRGNMLAQHTATQYVHITSSIDEAIERARKARRRPFDKIIQ